MPALPYPNADGSDDVQKNGCAKCERHARALTPLCLDQSCGHGHDDRAACGGGLDTPAILRWPESLA